MPPAMLSRLTVPDWYSTERWSIRVTYIAVDTQPVFFSRIPSSILTTANMLSKLFKQATLASVALATVASAYSTCVVPFGGQGVDDSAAVRALLPNCSSNAEIVFSSCTTYNISTPINFGTLNNVTISILGNLNLPSSIPYVQSLVNATAKGSLYWFTFAGVNVTLQGNQNPAEGFVYPQ